MGATRNRQAYNRSRFRAGGDVVKHRSVAVFGPPNAHCSQGVDKSIAGRYGFLATPLNEFST
jgi:hypothetical protein